MTQNIVATHSASSCLFDTTTLYSRTNSTLEAGDSAKSQSPP